MARLARFQLTGTAADADLAIEYALAAVSASPPTGPATELPWLIWGLSALPRATAQRCEQPSSALREAAELKSLPSYYTGNRGRRAGPAHVHA